jgi:glycosyltransferase involved in cell wall biosynthesis
MMTGDPSTVHAVIIPAYNPALVLIEILRSLAMRGIGAIVLIDDGSAPEYRDLFARAAALPRVRLLRHEINRGKGAALKTGIHFVLEHFPSLAGIVTADADGQHDPDDILRIVTALESNEGTLVMGARRFEGGVPLRSLIGNVLTRHVVNVLLGRRLADTQTGLRGIPASMLARLLELPSNGYEFELEMLLLAHSFSVPILEEPIRTIYEKGNQSSHFRPLVDSLKIYLVLLRFYTVSLLSSGLPKRPVHLMRRLIDYVQTIPWFRPVR